MSEAANLTDHDYKVLLDAISIAKRLENDKRVTVLASHAADSLAKLFDTCADISDEAMTPPF